MIFHYNHYSDSDDNVRFYDILRFKIVFCQTMQICYNVDGDGEYDNGIDDADDADDNQLIPGMWHVRDPLRHVLPTWRSCLRPGLISSAEIWIMI